MRIFKLAVRIALLLFITMGSLYWYKTNHKEETPSITLVKGEGMEDARPPLHEIATYLRDTQDPRTFTQQSPRYLSEMFFEGLTRISPTGEMELALAESVEIAEDLMTYTFLLRSSNWSNGDAVTAYDIETSWKEVLSPYSSLQPPETFYSIRNAKIAKRGRIPMDMVGVWAKDNDTLVLRLEEPNPFFLEQLSHPAFYPMHPSILKYPCGPASNTSFKFISNGQYMIQKNDMKYILLTNPRHTSPLD